MAPINLERQSSLGLELPKGVAIVGCGGVGSWAALQLALAGVDYLWLWDHDEVSDHNLNRLPVPPEAIGSSKSKAVADVIRMLRPDVRALALGKFDPEQANLMDMEDAVQWVVCSTDSAASRHMVREWCRKAYVSYVEASAEGEIGGCTDEPPEWSTPEEEQPGYRSVPVWVGPCVMSAAVACYHVLHNTGLSGANIRLGWEHNEEQNAGRFIAELHD